MGHWRKVENSLDLEILTRASPLAAMFSDPGPIQRHRMIGSTAQIMYKEKPAQVDILHQVSSRLNPVPEAKYVSVPNLLLYEAPKPAGVPRIDRLTAVKPKKSWTFYKR